MTDPASPAEPMQSGGPMGLLAELTHRCPLGCPYCSNPLALEGREGELSTQDWRSVFSQAARLGILQVHLSGGEPAARRDLVELVAHCAAEGLYTNLITSGVGVTETLVANLAAAGLDHVQLSVQDVEPESADRIAGYRGAFERKRALARTLVEAGFPLTINAVVHKANVARAEALVDLAIAWGARRVEIAHTQYYGWALSNRGLLLPDRPEAERAIRAVERRKREVEGQIVVDHVLPDYHADRPKACMGGWGRRIMNVTPSGKVLPCHAAESIPGLVFWSVRERSLGEIWTDSPAFNAYRGTAWMKEPCRSCDRREVDFGGCRCQAMMFAGDAAATDPVCSLSPHHALLRQFQQESAPIQDGYVYRRMPKPARATAGETDPTPA